MSGLIDLKGQRFGRLTVVEKATKQGNGQMKLEFNPKLYIID